MKYIVFALLILTHIAVGQRVLQRNMAFGATAQLISNTVRLSTKDGPGVISGIEGRNSWSAGIYVQSRSHLKWGWRIDAQYATRNFKDDNSRAGYIFESKPTIGFLDLAGSVHYYPFWRYPIGLSLFGGPMVQVTQRYRAEILRVNFDRPPPFPIYWDKAALPPQEVRIASTTLGGQIGVAYEYRQLTGHVAYQQMFAPQVSEGVHNGLWNTLYHFSSINVGLSFRLFNRKNVY